MPPMGTNFAAEDGQVTEQLVDYYEERAKGGVGLIIVEASCMDFPLGQLISRQLRVDEDQHILGLSRLVERVHSHGAKIALQIAHGGRLARARAHQLQPVAPSAIPAPGRETPRELTVGEIGEIVLRFTKAAGRAKKAGFDAVELHGAHGYLFHQFFSRASNKRQDQYGGDLRGRARLHLEALKEVRQEVGPNYPVLSRVTATEYGIQDSITLEETCQLAALLEKAGLDAIDVSGFAYGFSHPIQRASGPHQPGFLVPLAEGVKRVVGIPVITVGRLDPELGEKALQEGKADLVAFGRSLIADPYLPSKAAKGRLEDIRYCTGCTKCRDALIAGGSIICEVNPALGREKAYRLAPAARPKRVVVVGGGVAGMEAAQVAAQRGHQVWLYEQGPSLGGQLLVAAKPPEKENLAKLNQHMIAQVNKLPVKLKLGERATPGVLESLKPEAVVLATGSRPVVPDIPGMGKLPVVQAVGVLEGKVKVGERVVVIGGELVGCETAEYLAERGKRVTVTRRSKEMATKMNPTPRQHLLRRLSEKGVTLLPGVKYEGITEKGLEIIDSDGKRRLLEADTIVLAAGAQANDELGKALEGKGAEIYRIGDCVEPRNIKEAIAEGYAIGRQL